MLFAGLLFATPHNFKHYDHFYLLLTIAIVTFLHDTFDMVTLLACGSFHRACVNIKVCHFQF